MKNYAEKKSSTIIDHDRYHRRFYCDVWKRQPQSCEYFVELEDESAYCVFMRGDGYECACEGAISETLLEHALEEL